MIVLKLSTLNISCLVSHYRGMTLHQLLNFFCNAQTIKLTLVNTKAIWFILSGETNKPRFIPKKCLIMLQFLMK